MSRKVSGDRRFANAAFQVGRRYNAHAASAKALRITILRSRGQV